MYKKLYRSETNKKIAGVCGDDAALYLALLQQILLQLGDEATEDVTGTKVDPDRILHGGLSHLLPVKLGQSYLGIGPEFGIFQRLRIHFH